MTPTAVATPPSVLSTWRRNTPHVRKALAFIRARGCVTADELVDWDRRHGRRLFEWDDPAAAEEWRTHQARQFLNSFRATFENKRVRAFIHVREDAEADIPRDAYFTVESIARHDGMRQQVIADVVRRMASLAAELRMWNLTDEEQRVLFARLACEIGGTDGPADVDETVTP